MNSAVTYLVFAGSAPDDVWQDIAELFVETFSATPYLEDPDELGTIVRWGPEQLGHDGGRLVTARRDGRIVGFALAHALRADPAWLSILSQLETAAYPSPALPPPPATSDPAAASATTSVPARIGPASAQASASAQAPVSNALARPDDAVVVHELAVREADRGRGIAGACLVQLLQDRPESQTFIGVYERATEAASMYRHWGLADIGRVPMPGDAIALHVLTAPTAQIVARLAHG